MVSTSADCNEEMERNSIEWVTNCACSRHICRTRSLFTHLKDEAGSVHVENMEYVNVKGVGTVHFAAIVEKQNCKNHSARCFVRSEIDA